MEESLNLMVNSTMVNVVLFRLSLHGLTDISSAWEAHSYTYLSLSPNDIMKYESV